MPSLIIQHMSPRPPNVEPAPPAARETTISTVVAATSVALVALALYWSWPESTIREPTLARSEYAKYGIRIEPSDGTVSRITVTQGWAGVGPGLNFNIGFDGDPGAKLTVQTTPEIKTGLADCRYFGTNFDDPVMWTQTADPPLSSVTWFADRGNELNCTFKTDLTKIDSGPVRRYFVPATSVSWEAKSLGSAQICMEREPDTRGYQETWDRNPATPAWDGRHCISAADYENDPNTRSFVDVESGKKHFSYSLATYEGEATSRSGLENRELRIWLSGALLGVGASSILVLFEALVRRSSMWALTRRRTLRALAWLRAQREQ